MRICVTGSAGFIGRYSVRALINGGHKVIGIDRNLPDHQGAVYGKYKAFRADITDPAAMLSIFRQEQPQAVLHLAANSSLQLSVRNALVDAMANVMGTIIVLGAAQQVKAQKVVFASTSAVYGPSKKGIYYEESPIIPQVPYGISKAAGEMYCRASHIPYTILRYGNVYGPGQKPLGENILIARALAHFQDGAEFRINGDGEQIRDWIYVLDVAEANFRALFSPMMGTFNIATGRGASVNRIVDRIQKLSGSNGRVPHGPEKPGELRKVILRSERARALGWIPRTRLIQGLAETVKAWR